MVSVATPNRPPIDNAAAALRGGASNADANAPQSKAAPAGGTAPAGRGPAVLVDLSAAADLATRQNALDALNAMPNDLANALSDQVQKGTDALNTLDQAKKATAADRKKDAEDKLEQATKKLQLLQMLGADPKTMAKQAKDIGKEIKDAASEYTTALKDEAGGSKAAAATPASPADPVAAAETATSAASGLAASSPDATSAATPDATAAAADPAQAATKNADPAAAPQAVVQPPLSAADKAAADAIKHREGQHERDVVAAFKAAAKTVKQVLDNAAQQLKARNPLDPAAGGGAHDRTEMDKAVQDLADTVQIKQAGGDISDSAGPAAAPAPLDILA
jgi:hypothetical protein